MTLGEKIKKLRLDQKMTQAELAEKLYVTRQAITNYERNANMPSIDILKLMAKLFEVELDYLLKEESFEVTTQSDEKKRFHLKPIVFIIPSIFIVIIILLSILLPNILKDYDYVKVGFYLSYDENITYTVEELDEYNVPYLYSKYDKKKDEFIQCRNIISLYDETILSNEFDHVYHYEIHNILGTNNYRMILVNEYDKVITGFTETDYFGNNKHIVFLKPVTKVNVISYDKYNEIIYEDLIYIDENNVICSKYGNYYHENKVYTVNDSVRYYIEFVDDSKKLFNVLETKEILIFMYNGEYDIFNNYRIQFKIS